MSDLIERSEVLKQLRLDHKDVIYIDKVECAKRIKAIPSERPKGEWIDQHESGHGFWVGVCSLCGKEKRVDNYCPNCGADMRERKEGE